MDEHAAVLSSVSKRLAAATEHVLSGDEKSAEKLGKEVLLAGRFLEWLAEQSHGLLFTAALSDESFRVAFLRAIAVAVWHGAPRADSSSVGGRCGPSSGSSGDVTGSAAKGNHKGRDSRRHPDTSSCTYNGTAVTGTVDVRMSCSGSSGSGSNGSGGRSDGTVLAGNVASTVSGAGTAAGASTRPTRPGGPGRAKAGDELWESALTAVNQTMPAAIQAKRCPALRAAAVAFARSLLRARVLQACSVRLAAAAADVRERLAAVSFAAAADTDVPASLRSPSGGAGGDGPAAAPATTFASCSGTGAQTQFTSAVGGIADVAPTPVGGPGIVLSAVRALHHTSQLVRFLAAVHLEICEDGTQCTSYVQELAAALRDSCVLEHAAQAAVLAAQLETAEAAAAEAAKSAAKAGVEEAAAAQPKGSAAAAVMPESAAEAAMEEAGQAGETEKGRAGAEEKSAAGSVLAAPTKGNEPAPANLLEQERIAHLVLANMIHQAVATMWHVLGLADSCASSLPATAADLRAALSGGCVSHLMLAAAVAVLHAVDRGPTYGMPTLLPRTESDEHALYTAARLLAPGPRAAPPGPSASLQLLLRIARLAVGSARAWAEAEQQEASSRPANQAAAGVPRIAACAAAPLPAQAASATSSGLADMSARNGRSSSASSSGPPFGHPVWTKVPKRTVVSLATTALESAGGCLKERRRHGDAVADEAVEFWRLAAAAAADLTPLAYTTGLHAVGRLLRLEVGRMPLAKGTLPPAPPPEVRAALEGGLLSCMERLMRRAGEAPDGREAVVLASLLNTVARQRMWFSLLAYGDRARAAALVRTLGKLLRRLTPALLTAMQAEAAEAAGRQKPGGGGSGSDNVGGGGSGVSGGGNCGTRCSAAVSSKEATSGRHVLLLGATVLPLSHDVLAAAASWCAAAAALTQNLGPDAAAAPPPPASGVPGAQSATVQLACMASLAAQEWLPPLSRFVQQAALLSKLAPIAAGHGTLGNGCLAAAIASLLTWLFGLPGEAQGAAAGAVADSMAAAAVHSGSVAVPPSNRGAIATSACPASAAVSSAAVRASAVPAASSAPSTAASAASASSLALRRLLVEEVGAVPLCGAALRLTMGSEEARREWRQQVDMLRGLAEVMCSVATRCTRKVRLAALSAPQTAVQGGPTEPVVQPPSRPAVGSHRARGGVAGTAAQPCAIGRHQDSARGAKDPISTGGTGSGEACTHVHAVGGSGTDRGSGCGCGDSDAGLSVWPLPLLKALSADLRTARLAGAAHCADKLAAQLELWGAGMEGGPEEGPLSEVLSLFPDSARPFHAGFMPPSAARRLLRSCANPGCTNLAGDSEAELPLKACAGCGAVGYCGRDCQTAHWRAGHKDECRGRADTSERSDEA